MSMEDIIALQQPKRRRNKIRSHTTTTNMLTDNYIQIDAMEFKDGYVRCNMYTQAGCVVIFMKDDDYKHLQRQKFFIREGIEKDSAGVLNTTHEYHLRYPEKED
jgi:uncharacterized protein YeeX (DUF496 family)